MKICESLFPECLKFFDALKVEKVWPGGNQLIYLVKPCTHEQIKCVLFAQIMDTLFAQLHENWPQLFEQFFS